MELNVLYIDDERMLLRATTRLLSMLGVNVVSAPLGELGVNLAMSPDARFDLILCDMQMPHMSGVEVVRELRSRGCQTPVIFYSGHLGPWESEANGLVACGEVLMVLDKPADLETFEGILSGLDQ